jgi:surfactin synthase thioesterase subunit
MSWNNTAVEGGEALSIPLICLPYAGAGPSTFGEWQRHSSGMLEVMPLQLPGREKLFALPPYRTIEEAVIGLSPQLQECIQGHNEVLLFGHSMGAVLAYELARQLLVDRSVEVLHLFVSGSPAPTCQRTEKATGLSDNEFLDQVVDLAGYRHPALEDPEMRELLLPALRADVEMHEGYAPTSRDPIPVPITSIRGHGDHLVSQQDAARWKTATSEAFAVAELAGGHMYLVDHPAELVHLIEEAALMSRPICNS